MKHIACLLLWFVFFPVSFSWMNLAATSRRENAFSVRSRANTLLLRTTETENENIHEKQQKDASLAKERAPSSQQQQEMTAQQIMAALGTSPRRIALSALSATALALGADFLGVTGKLLGLFPESAIESSGLDTYYPIGGFKRVKGGGYSFLIPKEWVGDTALELAKAQRKAKALDYYSTSRRSSSGGGVLPDTAFGPPGRLNSKGVSQGDTNVSVVLSKGMGKSSLSEALGPPTEAAETYLRASLAPEGSGRSATLLDATDSDNTYRFEYEVDRGSRGVPLRAISVIAIDQGTLLTLTVVAPKEDWKNTEYEAKLQKVAASFHLK